jgi:succinyl-CoA synthetase beta subunit
MNIHEYQAKEIFRKYSLPTPMGEETDCANEAVNIAKRLGGDKWVIKAQIHAGGRGKAGGVHIAKDYNEVLVYSKNLLGSILITEQTGAKGKEIHKVYIESVVDIDKEYYLSILLDREHEQTMLIASTEGGMDIEEVAKNTPEKIIKIPIDASISYQPFYGRKLAFALGLQGDSVKKILNVLSSLYEIYIQNDVEMIEINPLVFTKDKDFIAIDAKISFDDNALYKHKHLEELRDIKEEDSTEVQSREYGLNYIKLDGNVGCMVNGAGLAMATMDIIKHEGGEPANFLDVGRLASASTVAKGFVIIISDVNVKSIFVNIFGGIVRCDRVASGIISALDIAKVDIPIVVRLEGTNSKEAKEMLKEANISNIFTADSLLDGAKKSVKYAQEI